MGFRHIQTQFSIEKGVWKSKIGARAINEVNETSIGYYVDENSQWMGPTKDVRPKAPQQSISRLSRDQLSRRTSSKPKPSSRPRNRSGFFGIQIPTLIMLSEWNKDEPQVTNSDASKDARLAMKAVDDSMKNLRKSTTINALERSSLDVAVSLVSVASHDECHNPFLCLQQAAIFAAMGPKLGNSDEPFKVFLPLKKKCTALNALVILGRADCLRAIHFLESAHFLCSWVATVCSMHRSSTDDELPWNSRWRVIGAYLSFVSANIDGTAAELGMDVTEWEDPVKEEIVSGKSDAKALLSSRQGIEASNNSDDRDSAEDYPTMPMLEKCIPQQHLDTSQPSTDDVDEDDFDDQFEFDDDGLDNAVEETAGDDNMFAGMNWASV